MAKNTSNKKSASDLASTSNLTAADVVKVLGMKPEDRGNDICMKLADAVTANELENVYIFQTTSVKVNLTNGKSKFVPVVRDQLLNPVGSPKDGQVKLKDIDDRILASKILLAKAFKNCTAKSTYLAAESDTVRFEFKIVITEDTASDDTEAQIDIDNIDL